MMAATVAGRRWLGRHLTKISDLTAAEVAQLLDKAAAMKRDRQLGAVRDTAARAGPRRSHALMRRNLVPLPTDGPRAPDAADAV
jgi:hypothetical protein